MSDDEDYMSDKFLQGCEQHVSSSLIYKHSDRREFALMKKRTEIESRMKEQNKPMRVVEAEKREEGLASAITSANKGFEMLMKMGYKPGQGIGKTQSGMTEPIPVEVKVDRQGLGKTLKKKESYSKNHENTNANSDNMNTRDFRSRLAQEKAEQLQKVDLYKSQKVCQELDAKENIEKPEEFWFWPDSKEIKEEEKEENDTDDNEIDQNIEDLSNLEKLDILTKYLRKKYFYCIWCGLKFDDENDLRDNCPGSTRNDH